MIEQKYLDMFEQLKQAHAGGIRGDDGTAARAGSRAGGANASAGEGRARARFRRRGRGAVHGPNKRKGRVHQVLATLGYGDAIGHEVLGIQRVLRARRLRVGDFRRDRRSAASKT